MTTFFERARSHLGLALLLIIAAGLRFWGLSFGLPHDHCRPDEVTLVHHALSIGAGDLNPHFFNYPSLHFYLFAAAFGAYFATGYGLGAFSGLQDFELSFFLDPSPFYLIGRSLSALLGTASVWLLYRIGTALGATNTETDPRRCGRISAMFLAVCFLHVRDSHFATTDIAAACYFLAAGALALRHAQTENNRDLYLSAVLIGLAASTKYNLAIFAITPLVTGWHGPTAHALRRLLIAGSLMAAAFLAGSPYIALDFTAFWRDLLFERGHFYHGHGMDLGRGWLYHLQHTLPDGLGWPLFGAGLAGAVRWGWRGRRGEVALLLGLLGYYAVSGSGKSVFYRYAIPMLPLLCLAAGALVCALARTPARAWAAALLIAAPTAWASLHHTALLARPDTRLLAARWIEQHVPDGAKIARCCHRSLYGHPQLRLSEEAAEQRRSELSQAGSNYRRWRHLQALAAKDPRPGYDLVELVRDDHAGHSWTWSQYDIDRLRREQVGWVVVQEHPHLRYSQTDASLVASLQGYEAQIFDPFRDVETPIYDPIDAYYLPVAGFAGVDRAGPKITIYRIDGLGDSLDNAYPQP